MRIKGNGRAIWGVLYTGYDRVSYSETEMKTIWDRVKALCEAGLLQCFRPHRRFIWCLWVELSVREDICWLHV